MTQSEQKQVGVISKVAGPLIIAKGMKDVQMYDVVRVSNKKLIGVVSVVNITLTTNTQYIYINNSAENVNIIASSNILLQSFDNLFV